MHIPVILPRPLAAPWTKVALLWWLCQGFSDGGDGRQYSIMRQWIIFAFIKCQIAFDQRIQRQLQCFIFGHLHIPIKKVKPPLASSIEPMVSTASTTDKIIFITKIFIPAPQVEPPH